MNIISYAGDMLIQDELLLVSAQCEAFSDHSVLAKCWIGDWRADSVLASFFNPYPTAFPYGNGMVLHFYQQQESSTTKTVHKVINKGLKTYV